MTNYCIVIGLLLVGCDDGVPAHFKKECVTSNSTAQSCMIECARAANPHSDEEGEDLVRECATQCRLMNCSQNEWFYYRRPPFPSTGRWERCTLASPEVKVLCRKVGWEEGP